MKKEEILALLKKYLNKEKFQTILASIKQNLNKDKFKSLYNTAKQNPKQLIVAGIILLFAIIILTLGLKDKPAPKVVLPEVNIKDLAPHKEETKTIPLKGAEKTITTKDGYDSEISKEVYVPTTAVLNFTATLEQDMTFEVFYTTKRDTWFNSSEVLRYNATEGTNTYAIELPVKEIYRIRLDFAENSGAITFSDMHLSGTQEADLRDYSLYEFSQLGEITYNEDGSISFVVSSKDPYIAYRKELKQ